MSGPIIKYLIGLLVNLFISLFTLVFIEITLYKFFGWILPDYFRFLTLFLVSGALAFLYTSLLFTIRKITKDKIVSTTKSMTISLIMPVFLLVFLTNIDFRLFKYFDPYKPVTIALKQFNENLSENEAYLDMLEKYDLSEDEFNSVMTARGMKRLSYNELEQVYQLREKVVNLSNQICISFFTGNHDPFEYIKVFNELTNDELALWLELNYKAIIYEIEDKPFQPYFREERLKYYAYFFSNMDEDIQQIANKSHTAPQEITDDQQCKLIKSQLSKINSLDKKEKEIAMRMFYYVSEPL